MLEETEHEYRRLLYVAMTRAADQLIIAGCKPGNRDNIREHSWYDLVAEASTIPGWRCRKSRPRWHRETLRTCRGGGRHRRSGR